MSQIDIIFPNNGDKNFILSYEYERFNIYSFWIINTISTTTTAYIEDKPIFQWLKEMSNIRKKMYKRWFKQAILCLSNKKNFLMNDNEYTYMYI